MPAYKCKYRSGKTMWYYMFALPGSTRQHRDRISESGFSTKRETEDAETRRRIEEQQKEDLAKVGARVTGPLPQTLSMLLEEFFRQHVESVIAVRTAEKSPARSAAVRGKRADGGRLRANAKKLQRGEIEQLVANDASASGQPELVLDDISTTREECVARIQVVITQEVVEVAMVVIGAGARDGV